MLSLVFFIKHLTEAFMPLSRYCKRYCLPEDPNRVMLFSTRTTAVIHVSQEVLEDIEKDALTEEERKTLSEEGFLAESAEAERRELLGCIDDLNSRTRTFTAIVVLSLDCNLACRYCFEGSRKGKHYMSAETADAFLSYLNSGVLEGKDEIKLVFYGGEPLLSQDMIIRISEAARSVSEARGIKFSFSFITNGTLLTTRAVAKLKPLGLTAACITLDGPREVHDAFRPFTTGKGSFDAIVRNIQDICSEIDVHVGGNYTRDSYREFPRLLDFFLASGLTPAKLPSIKFDPVFSECNEFAPPDFRDGCMSVNEPWLFEAGGYLREEVLRRGFRTQKIEPVVCFMERPANVVVNYDGALYKCPGLIGRKDYCAGSLKSGILDYRETLCLDNWKNEECLACAYLPLCFGGCRYMKLVREGTMKGIDCKKEYFDRTLEAFVLQDVRYDNADES